MNDLFYNQFFNPQYMNSAYYWQNQEQIVYYQQAQSKEVCNDYFTPWNAPIRNKENGNPNQGTHQS